ncbi:MAG: zinc-ribbon domain-containing protein, partial [Candidatus Altiarchaeales archaeon]|nr:zinc-ribbon domain-containing protein [Candidatus Altiarchaeales archaeon]
MSFCTKCGAGLEEGDVFCSKCGSEVEKRSTST